jgi:predicted aspartyl protease
VRPKAGTVVSGHPYIDILISPDGKKSAKQTALVDTGFSGFVSIPTASARLMGLKAHATTLYTLANGQTSEPVPLAHGYACLEGDSFVEGLFSISEHTSTVVGMDFLIRCGKVLLVGPAGIVMVNADELKAAFEQIGTFLNEGEAGSKSKP